MSNELAPYSIWMTGKSFESRSCSGLYFVEEPIMAFAGSLP